MGHWHLSNTHAFWTCMALLEGRNISHKTEIREVNGWRLDAIIRNLKKKYHWPIIPDCRGPENSEYYRLDTDCKSKALSLPGSAKGLKQEIGL